LSLKVLGVIPARGGSKRFPKKNIAPLKGKPLIQYSIDAVKNSNLLTSYVFSTDDAEIHSTALSLGAFAPFLRPAKLAGDNIRNSAVMIHAVEYMEDLNKIKYDYIALLQPTSPLRTSHHIDEAISLITNAKTMSLASVKGPYRKRDITLKKIVENKLTNLINKNEEFYLYNASIYIVNKEWLLKEKKFTSDNEIPYVMDDISSVDVDEEFDLHIAESALTFKEKKHHETT